MLQGRLQLLDLLLQAMHLRLCRSQGLSTLCPIAKLPLQLFCLLSLVCCISLHHWLVLGKSGSRTAPTGQQHCALHTWCSICARDFLACKCSDRRRAPKDTEQSHLAHLCAGSTGAQLW